MVIVTTLGFGTFLPLWIRIVKPNEATVPIGSSLGDHLALNKIDSDINVTLLGHLHKGYIINKEDLTKKRSWLH